MSLATTLKQELAQLFPFAKDHEWDLAYKFRFAFDAQDFKTCAKIKREVDLRIRYGRCNDTLMNGFRCYNPTTKQYEGPANTGQFYGLFSEYFIQKGIAVC